MPKINASDRLKKHRYQPHIPKEAEESSILSSEFNTDESLMKGVSHGGKINEK